MSFHTISAILRGGWLIDKNYVDQHLILIYNIVNGKASGAEMFKGSAEMEQPFVYNNGKRYDAYKIEWKPGIGAIKVLNSEEWPDNSTIVIPTIGPITKYNGDCGEPGMVQRSAWVNDLVNSDKISKLVSWIDSPGGQADGTPQYADFLRTVDKPKTAYVDGGAFSAGAWISSAHDNIVLSNSLAEFGSIGAYCTFVDYSGFFKQKGIKVKDIYAKQSTDKNDAYRKAMDNDFSGYQQSADECAAAFIEGFAENRGDKLKGNAWNTGKIFSAAEALDMGLVDSIGSFKDAAQPSKSKSFTKPSSNNNNMKFQNLTALSNVAEPTDEQIDQANAELTTENITAVTLVRESFITEAEAETTRANSLQEQVNTLTASAATQTTELTNANSTIASQVTKITELEAKVSAFGKNAGALHQEKKGEDTPPEGGDNTADLLSGLAHNQTADKVLGKK
jgi:ClpP class serine protease